MVQRAHDEEKAVPLDFLVKLEKYHELWLRNSINVTVVENFHGKSICDLAKDVSSAICQMFVASL